MGQSELGDKCNVARIEFKDGKFVVTFADSVDHLTSDAGKRTLLAKELLARYKFENFMW